MPSLHKSYLISLAAFLGINITFGLIYIALTNGWGNLMGDPMGILVYLLQSVFFFPGYLIGNFGGSGFNLAKSIFLIGSIIALVVSAVLSGYFGESKGAAFGGFALTLITAWAVLIILSLFSFPSVENLFGSISESFNRLFQIAKEEDKNIIEAYFIANEILGLGASFEEIAFFYFYAVPELGGIQNLLLWAVVLDYESGGATFQEAIIYGILLKKIGEESSLSQFFWVNYFSGIYWADFQRYIELKLMFDMTYIPPVNTADLSYKIITIAEVSIATIVNIACYGVVSLLVKRVIIY
jgi:hypothetical protein